MTVITKQPRYQGLFLHPILSLVVSLIGLGLSILLVFLFVAAGVMALVQDGLNAQLLTLFTMGWTALLVGGLFLFPIVQSIQQLTGRETHFATRSYLKIATVMMVLWLPLLLLGQVVAARAILPWLILPPLQMFLVVTPIFFLIELARRNLPHPEGAGWGVYGIGVLLTQPLVIFLELVALVILAAAGLAWLSTQPVLWSQITNLADRLTYAQMNPQLTEQILLPYLRSPAVLIGVLAIGAGLLPLIEELLKPLAVWVMASRKLEESTGFVLGLFAGGTFALLESLGMAASTDLETWASVLTARVGTGVLHVTTTALTGWGLASAWKYRKYLRLGLMLLVSFSLHAVWNAFGLLLGLERYLPESVNGWLKPARSIVLVAMALIMVLILLIMNLRLQRVEFQRKQALAQGVTPGQAELPAVVDTGKDAEAE